MKILKETTNWKFPNHTYYLNDEQDKVLGIKQEGTNEVQMFKQPLRFQKRNRTFIELKGE